MEVTYYLLRYLHRISPNYTHSRTLASFTKVLQASSQWTLQLNAIRLSSKNSKNNSEISNSIAKCPSNNRVERAKNLSHPPQTSRKNDHLILKSFKYAIRILIDRNSYGNIIYSITSSSQVQYLRYQQLSFYYF